MTFVSDEKKIKIGILTFHNVYNYGAVLQAYALQQYMNCNGFENEIINFSRRKQKDLTDIVSTRNGIKRFIKSLLLLPVLSQRIVRKKKFDDFINHRLYLSKKVYNEKSDISDTNSLYSTFVIGSDQVWNVRKKSDTSLVYFLKFADNNKKKIAYAPSVGISTINELQSYKEELLKFDFISCREFGGARELSKLLNKDVPVVLDPTLLIQSEVLMKLSDKADEEKYILYYSLDGFDKRKHNMEILDELKKKFNLKLKIITPEWPFHRKYGDDIVNAGPEEFITLIKNAELVCTTSFHGTALAIKFERPLFVLEDKDTPDERKRSLLNQLGIENRIISCMDDVNKNRSYYMDYVDITKKLNKLQKQSSEYLINSLEKCREK